MIIMYDIDITGSVISIVKYSVILVDLCIGITTQDWETCVSPTQNHSETKGEGIFKGDLPIAFWYISELWISRFSLSFP